MSRTTNPRRRSRHTVTPETVAAAITVLTLPQALERIANPVAFAKMIEQSFFQGTIDDNPVHDSFERLRGIFLSEIPEIARLYDVLDEVDKFCLVEAAIRNAGFVLGFATATRLLTGLGFAPSATATEQVGA